MNGISAFYSCILHMLFYVYFETCIYFCLFESRVCFLQSFYSYFSLKFLFLFHFIFNFLQTYMNKVFSKLYSCCFQRSCCFLSTISLLFLLTTNKSVSRNLFASQGIPRIVCKPNSLFITQVTEARHFYLS